MIAWVLLVISRRFLLFHLSTLILFFYSSFIRFHYYSFQPFSFSTFPLIFFSPFLPFHLSSFHLFHFHSFRLFHFHSFPLFHFTSILLFLFSSFLLSRFSTLILLYKSGREEKNNSTFNSKYLNQIKFLEFKYHLFGSFEKNEYFCTVVEKYFSAFYDMTVSKIATVVNGDVIQWWVYTFVHQQISTFVRLRISTLSLFFFGTLVLRYDSAFELLTNKNQKQNVLIHYKKWQKLD